MTVARTVHPSSRFPMRKVGSTDDISSKGLSNVYIQSTCLVNDPQSVYPVWIDVLSDRFTSGKST